MQLQSLKVNQFCQFRTPIALEGLTAGINLITGPNESGKTTLINAIRSVFFERYSSSTLKKYQPWGDSSATPQVEVSFLYNQQAWKIAKQFVSKQRCDLAIDNNTFTNQEAEDKLAELLSYQYAASGASKAQHWGVPGLLWVEQGTGHELKEAAGHAGDYLKSVLGGLLGEVVSTDGDDVLQQITQQLSEFQTATGQDRGIYKDSKAELQTQTAEIERLKQKIEQHKQQVDLLGRQKAELTELEQQRNWEILEVQRAEAQQKLQQAEQQEERLTTAQKQFESLQGSLQLIQQQTKQYQQLEERLKTREKELETATAQQNAIGEQLQQATNHSKICTLAYQTALSQQQWAVDAQRLQQRQHDITQIQKQLQRQAESLAAAKQAFSALQQLPKQEKQSRITSESIAKLRELQRQCELAEAGLNAVATRLHYRLETDQSVELNGNTLKGEDTVSLSGESQLSIKGIGEFRITAGGGHDVADQQRQYEKLQLQYQAVLAELQVEQPEQAEARLRQQQQNAADIQQHQQVLSLHAPQGLDVLQQEHDANKTALKHVQEEQQKLQQQLVGSAQTADENPNLENAKQQLEQSEEALKQAEKQLHELQLKQAEIKQSLNSAQRELTSLQEELNNPQRQEQHSKLQQQNDDNLAEQALTKRTIKDIEAQLLQAQPKILRQDIERLGTSIEQQKNNLAQKKLSIASLTAQLQTEGATGMEETLQTLEQQQDQTSKRTAELTRRVNALSLLKTLLSEKRQELTRQLQAPLQECINHYLNLLFPGATLEINDELIPENFQRNNEQGSIDALSFGAREQMNLIARLAYADLLKQAGKPTLIILDDALVHSDKERLQHMMRILYNAAERHQILLFSCHPQNWQELGAKVWEIEQLG